MNICDALKKPVRLSCLETLAPDKVSVVITKLNGLPPPLNGKSVLSQAMASLILVSTSGLNEAKANLQRW